MPIKLLDDDRWKSSMVPWVAALRDTTQAVNFADSNRDYDHHYRRLLESLKKTGVGSASTSERESARKSYLKSLMISRAAFLPGSPVIPPPGCVPAPQR